MRKKVWLFIGVLFLGLIAWTIFYEHDLAQKRKQHFALTKGLIVQAGVDGLNSSTLQITYRVDVADKQFERTSKVTCDNVLRLGAFMEMVGMRMDVVYEKDNPENCELLFCKRLYDQYGLTPPGELAPFFNSFNLGCGEGK